MPHSSRAAPRFPCAPPRASFDLMRSRTTTLLAFIARVFLLSLLVLGGIVGSFGDRVWAQRTFTVNATGDVGDATVGDGACTTGAQTPGGAPECTLRAALEEANQDAAQDTIRFDTVPRNAEGTALFSPATPLDVTQRVYVDGTTAPSHDVTAEGDLRLRISSLEQSMPGPGSEGFMLPTPGALETWNGLLQRILDGDILAARSIIEQQFPSYALIRFFDTETQQPYWLLQETPNVERGWGAVVVNPTPRRNLAIEVPHPKFDLDTHTEGADLFRETGARMLVLAGTHRCANSAASSCDGETGVCGDYGSYRVSDMAHFVEAPFQEAHRALTQRYPEVAVLNLHGNGSSSCETVFLSDGVENTSPPLIQNLHSALNGRGVNVGTPQTSACPLEGTTNVQGRYTNGSSAPCTAPASATAGTFVHIEQRLGFREDPAAYGALIEAVNEVVPVMTTSTSSAPMRAEAAPAATSFEGPVIGIDGGELSPGAHGITISSSEAAGTELRGLSVFNAPGAGIWGRASDLTVRHCALGLRPNGDLSPNGHQTGGSRVGALDLDGSDFTVQQTVVAGNESAGIVAMGRQGAVHNTVVGAGPDLQAVLPNAGTGLVVGGRGTTVQSNVVFGNGGHGIRVEQEGGVQIGYGYATDPPASPAPPGDGDGNVLAHNDSTGVLLTVGTGTALRGNRMYANGTGGIQITDAYDGNDDGDTDEGINRGQNVPIIEATTGCDEGATETSVQVEYRVRSTADSATASHYGDRGLQVDFYVASDGEQQGKTYLGTHDYPANAAGTSVTTELTGEGVACTDSLVATATDADGNTSRFNAPKVLPVELARFEGQQRGSGEVILTWATASEQNNAGFRVEHETSAEAWTEVGRVDGDGTRGEGQTYRFPVSGLGPGKHRFRLVQVDLDGGTTTYGPIQVRVGMRETLQLSTPSPTPVAQQAAVSVAVKTATDVELSIYNTLGQKVKTLYEGGVPADTRRHFTFEVDNLSSGTYFLRLSTEQHHRIRRFTVVH